MFNHAHNDFVVTYDNEKAETDRRRRRHISSLLFNFFLEHRERKIIDNNDERQRQIGKTRQQRRVFVDKLNASSLQCKLNNGNVADLS